MKVLVLGATGFIGRHAAAALRAAGHEVVASPVRFESALRPQAWLPSLEGVAAVVNAVGILRERGARTFNALHDAAPRALFQACEMAGVRRVVQVSALGADEGARSRFHLSKKRADDFLAARDLEWTIVQPSLVFGEGGHSARLFALLASLPVTPVPGDGRQRVQPIHIEDLAEVIVKLVGAPLKKRLPATGDIALRDWLGLLRAQMGLGKARIVAVPRALVPVDRETLRMLDRGNTASPAAVTQLLGRAPRRPEEFLAGKKRACSWLGPASTGCCRCCAHRRPPCGSAAAWFRSGSIRLPTASPCSHGWGSPRRFSLRWARGWARRSTCSLPTAAAKCAPSPSFRAAW